VIGFIEDYKYLNNANHCAIEIKFKFNYQNVYHNNFILADLIMIAASGA
jgi:hypothetical protein